MTRLEMVDAARQLAYEQVDGCSALNDAQYQEMLKLTEEEALERLAHKFLQEAADYNFGK